MKKFSVWIFTLIPLAAALALAADLIPKHGFDLSWSPRARFHGTWASAKLLALGIVVALIAQNALKKEKRWAWWAMVTYVVIGMGGMIPAILWHGEGPPAGPLVMIGTMVTLMVVALMGSAKTVFSSNVE